MAKKKVLSQETLAQINHYYIDELWNREQICKHFNFSETYFKKLIRDGLVQKKTQEQILQTMNDTNVERYGDANYRNLEQAKQTLLEKYGDENYRNIEQGMKTKAEKDPNWKETYVEKMQATKFERYGDSGYNNPEKISQTKKELMSDQNKKEEFLGKIRQTKLERYGDEKYCNTLQAQETIQQKLLQDPNLRKKWVQEASATKEKRYGNPNYNNIEQIKKTLLERYGDQHYFNIDKMKENNVSKYGVAFPCQRDISHYDIWSDCGKFERYLEDNPNQTYKELSIFFNVDRTTINQKVVDLGLQDRVQYLSGSSNYEFEIRDFLISECNVKEEEIEMHNRTVLTPCEIDIYIPSRNMGIEFNGDYWHSDIQEKFKDHGGRSTYHQKKSLKAEEKGVFLFHIFEYEWNNPVTQNNIKNRLKTLLNSNGIRVPARKCTIEEITKDQKKEFLNVNHIQGNDRSSVCYGLFYQDNLISCMTFTKPKNKQYTWELSRFCNKHDYIVQGGASKLFKYAISNMNRGDTVVSYNDITKTSGKIYKILDFSCTSVNNPNYIWMNFATGDIKTRYQEQAAGEVERMHNLGYHRICDCGTKTWLYIVK
jgi:hypothetical protein